MDYEPKYRPMTADDVLAALRDRFRQQVHFDPEATEYEGVELTFDTSVARWREVCDLIAPQPLGRAMNKGFEVNIDDSDWGAALTPEKSRTLRDVCNLLAGHAKAPMIESVCILGADCRPAGAFLLVRDALKSAGADVDQLRPSLPVSELFRRYGGHLLLLASKIAPGRMPPVRILDRAFHYAVNTFLAGFLLMGLGCCLWSTAPYFAVTGILILALGFVGMCISSGWVDAVEFEGIHTFRDLSYVLAGEQPRPPRRTRRTDSPPPSLNDPTRTTRN